MITIIDYGMGNIQSLKAMIEYLGERSVITADPQQILAAERVILPGVGAFGAAMHNLQQQGLITVVQQLVGRQTPVLGICLGMQLLGGSSTEERLTPGLALLDGSIEAFRIDNKEPGQKIPHVGFNEIEVVGDSRLFHGLPETPDFYFTHSFRMQCQDSSCVSSYAVNGERFVSSIERGNLFGTQFHPELSQDNGIQLMKNFIHRV